MGATTKSITGSGSQRIGDSFALGLERFASTSYGKDEVSLWRFYVAKHCGYSDTFVDVDATLPMLREMQRWIEKAIDTVQTDGGRKSDQPA